MKIFSRKWWLVIISVLILGLGWACGGNSKGGVPTDPSGLTATDVSSTQIILAWNDNSDNEYWFKIERKTEVEGIWEYYGSTTENVLNCYSDYSALANRVACIDSGLTPNTAYYYRVYAYNSAGNSNYSNEISVTTISGFGSWTTVSTGANVPSTRFKHTAVWTGSEMIVWGGIANFQEMGPLLNTGGRYNPSTDSWAPTSTGANVPSVRSGHTAVWTGTEMIVWGGNTNENYCNTGGRYNPSTDSWTPAGTGANVPTGRSGHTAVWTGTEMIVWGGSYYDCLATGDIYNPSTDSWTITSTGANVPSARIEHTAVWTGTEMIIWGGDDHYNLFNTGGRYNPFTDSWIATSTDANVPSPRASHTAVWTGTEMIIWGSFFGSLNTGGRYNPSTDSWIATSTGANVPSPRASPTAVWTGTEMIVWGGYGSLNTGGRYHPSTDSWIATSTGTNVPTARFNHTAVWTGTEMIVWGGSDGNTLNTGGIYSP